jgi:ribosomal protein S6--L-glutamate ligase
VATGIDKPVAIGARLKKFTQIHTIGFKPNFTDYTDSEQNLIRNAKKIYYPTAFYAALLNTMGIETFPSFHTYKFTLDKIIQTAIFELQGILHPKTRVFYGKKQKKKITEAFTFPFIAKKARGSARGDHVYLIRDYADLAKYLKTETPAYIQEYIPVDRDMRIIVIGSKIRLAFWRKAPAGDFKTNISRGGSICFDPLPQQALDLALHTAKKCGWNDVGIDIIESDGRFYVLEANMKYGTKGFVAAGLDYKKMLVDLIEQKEI